MHSGVISFPLEYSCYTEKMSIDDIFSAFHWLTVIAVIALIVFGVVVVAVLAKVFKSDFEQD
jgi:hypothetical protein